MLIIFLFGLLMSLSCISGLETQPNLDIWKIDESCNLYRPVLQKANNDVAIMAAKALKDLQFVQQPRPQHDHQLRMEWDRVARAVNNMFGFGPDEQGTDPENKYMNRILSVYGRMNEALQGDHNVPQQGFAGHGQAMWICGDTSWTWYAKNEEDPNNPGKSLSVSKPQLFIHNPGAWILGNRYLAGLPDNVGICRPNIQGITMPNYDFITFCLFAMVGPTANLQSITDWKKSVVMDQTLLDEFGRLSLSRVMIHEFAHWFGAQIKDGEIRRLPDQQAVSKHGELIWSYIDQNGKYHRVTTRDKKGVKYSPVVVYSYTRCARLARIYKGDNAQNSGPDKATETAEAYAYFAMMAYLDDFDWTSDGQAKSKY